MYLLTVYLIHTNVTAVLHKKIYLSLHKRNVVAKQELILEQRKNRSVKDSPLHVGIQSKMFKKTRHSSMYQNKTKRW